MMMMKLEAFFASLTDEELEQLLEWSDANELYEKLAQWVDVHRDALARRLFAVRGRADER